MSNPDDPARKDGLTPHGATPSWVDEVLGTSRTAPATPQVPVVVPLAKPESPAPRPAPAPSPWPEDLRIPEPAPRAALTSAPMTSPTSPAPTAYADDDWVSRAAGAQAKGPSLTPSPVRSELDSLGDTARHAMQQVQGSLGSSDAAQKKLIAGLLGIVLGSLGVHKFYLGMTTPGLIMLGVNVGVWILALVLGLITLGFGLVVTVPLAALVSSALGLLGLVEGIIYLTKSDADFDREYVMGKKPWL